MLSEKAILGLKKMVLLELRQERTLNQKSVFIIRNYDEMVLNKKPGYDKTYTNDKFCNSI